MAAIVTAAVDIVIILAVWSACGGFGDDGERLGWSALESLLGKSGGLAFFLHLDDLVGLLAGHVGAENMVPHGAKGLRKVALDTIVLVVDIMAREGKENDDVSTLAQTFLQSKYDNYG